MSEIAQVTIQRGKGYVDRLRSYDVTIDEKIVSTVRAGQAVTVPVAAGSHTLKLRIDWCGSDELRFEARPAEHIIFECGSNLTGWRILKGVYYVFFRRQQYLWLRRTTFQTCTGAK